MATLPTVENILEKDVFQLLNLEGIGEDKKEQLFEKMLNTVNARIINRVAVLLTDEEIDTFKKLAETNDTTKLVEFLQKKEIDLPTITAEEAIRYKVEISHLLTLAENK